MAELLGGDPAGWLTVLARIAAEAADRAGRAAAGRTAPDARVARRLELAAGPMSGTLSACWVPISWQSTGYLYAPTRFDGRLAIKPSSNEETAVTLEGEFAPGGAVLCLALRAAEAFARSILANFRTAAEEACRIHRAGRPDNRLAQTH
jgi:hypothetical protein